MTHPPPTSAEARESAQNGSPPLVMSCGALLPVPVIVVSAIVSHGDFLTTVYAGGAAPPEQVVTVRNAGSAPFRVTRITIDGTHRTDFTVAQDNCTGVIFNAGDQQTVRVVFRPSEAGARAATLYVSSTDAARAVTDRTLSGRGTVPAPALANPSAETFLASGAETITLRYDVRDPATVATGGTFEVRDKAGNVVLTRALANTEYAHGAVSIGWTGALAANTAAHPGGYVTVEHSPYTWRATITGGGATGPSSRAESRVKVEVAQITLALGPDSVLVKDQHKTALATLKPTGAADPAVPAVGETAKILLSSNRFKLNQAHSKHDNATSHDLHRDLWGDGPLIPLYATLLVRDSGGQPRSAPRALGNCPILWDYADVAKDNAALSTKAKAYVADASDRATKSSSPPGDNAHRDYGGKRGGASLPVFLTAHNAAEVNNTFPFALPDAGGQRTWAAYSRPTTVGSDAKTGVMFRPSRMAGDRYRVRVYADPGRRFDIRGDVTIPVKAETGIFEVWRQVDIVRVFRKTATVGTYTHADVQAYYDNAYLSLRNLATVPAAMPASFNDTVRAALVAEGSVLARYGVDNPAAQATAGDSVLTFLAPAAFVDAYVADKTTAQKITEYRQQNAGASDNDARTALTARATQELADAEYTHIDDPLVAQARYANKCEALGKQIAMAVCHDMLQHVQADGITLFFFTHCSNLRGDAESNKNGVGLNPTTHRGTVRMAVGKSGCILFATPADYYGLRTHVATIAHEIGHLLFLPHTATETKAQDADAHDADDNGCLMSYNTRLARQTCGYCLLRLRGWNHTALRPQGSRNAQRPALQVTVVPGSFAAVDPAPSFVSSRLVLRNETGGTVTITDVTKAGGNATDFVVTGVPAALKAVVAGDMVTLAVKVTVESAGRRRTTLSVVSSDAGNPQTITLETNDNVLTATAAAGAFSATLREVGVSKPLRFRNTGTAPLNVSGVELDGRDRGDYMLEDADAARGTLDPGSGKMVRVRFTPSEDGERLAVGKITSDAPGGPVTVELRSTGRAPVIDLPTEIQVGDVTVASTTTKTLRIRNTGEVPLVITAILIGGTDAADVTTNATLPLTVAGGDRHTLTVTYRCPSVGDKRASLTFISNASNVPTAVAVQAKGVAPLLVVKFDPVFGNTLVGDDEDETIHTMTLRNDGDSVLQLTTPGVACTGTNRTDFRLEGVPANFPHDIAAGDNFRVTVAFAPQTGGAKTATVTVSSTDAGRGPVYTVTGFGDVLPMIAIDPDDGLDFGDQQQGTASAPQTVTIANGGSAPLVVAGFVVNGAAFAVGNEVGNRTIAVQGTLLFDVTFTPAGVGEVNGTITINSNASNEPAMVIAVSGTGTA